VAVNCDLRAGWRIELRRRTTQRGSRARDTAAVVRWRSGCNAEPRSPATCVLGPRTSSPLRTRASHPGRWHADRVAREAGRSTIVEGDRGRSASSGLCGRVDVRCTDRDCRYALVHDSRRTAIQACCGLSEPDGGRDLASAQLRDGPAAAVRARSRDRASRIGNSVLVPGFTEAGARCNQLAQVGSRSRLHRFWSGCRSVSRTVQAGPEVDAVDRHGVGVPVVSGAGPASHAVLARRLVPRQIDHRDGTEEMGT
jgi:hypothetical protein